MTFKPFSGFPTEYIDSNHQFLEFHEFVHMKHENLKIGDNSTKIFGMKTSKWRKGHETSFKWNSFISSNIKLVFLNDSRSFISLM